MDEITVKIEELYEAINKLNPIDLGTLSSLVRFINGDPEQLYGIYNALSHIKSFKEIINDVNEHEYGLEIDDIIDLAETICDLHVKLVKEIPEIDTTYIKESQFKKISKKNHPIYHLLHYKPSKTSRGFSVITAHLMCLKKLDTTDEQQGTTASYGYKIEELTVEMNEEFAEELDNCLGQLVDAKKIHEALDLKANSTSIYSNKFEQLRHVMSACKDKEGHDKSGWVVKNKTKREKNRKNKNKININENAFAEPIMQAEENNTKKKQAKTRNHLKSNSKMNSSINPQASRTKSPLMKIDEKKTKEIEEKLKFLFNFKNRENPDDPLDLYDYSTNYSNEGEIDPQNEEEYIRTRCVNTFCRSMDKFEQNVNQQRQAASKCEYITNSHSDILNEFDIQIFINNWFFPYLNSNNPDYSLIAIINLLSIITSTEIKTIIREVKIGEVYSSLQQETGIIIDLENKLISKPITFKCHPQLPNVEKSQYRNSVSNCFLPLSNEVTEIIKGLISCGIIDCKTSFIFERLNTKKVTDKIENDMRRLNSKYETRLTRVRLENYITNKISANSSYGEIHAAFFKGCNHKPHMEVDITYICQSQELLSNVAIQSLKKYLPQFCTFDFRNNKIILFDSDRYYGSHRTPKDGVIQSRLNDLNMQIMQAKDEDVKHNSTVQLFLYHIIVGGNCRHAVKIIYHKDNIAQDTGLVFFNDKDRDKDSHPRLVCYEKTIINDLISFTDQKNYIGIDTFLKGIYLLTLSENETIIFPKKTWRKAINTKDLPDLFYSKLSDGIAPFNSTHLIRRFRPKAVNNDNRHYCSSKMHEEGFLFATNKIHMSHANRVHNPTGTYSRYLMGKHLKIILEFNIEHFPYS